MSQQSAAPAAKSMPWLVKGDIDGFFGLALDNLVQLLLILSLCGGVLGFPDDLVFGRILPGAAISLLFGNLFYAWQAKRLAAVSGRSDVCALPYGINTVSLIAFVFLVMLPAKLAAQAAGSTNPAQIAWQAGLLACFSNGVIELIGALVAERLRRCTPGPPCCPLSPGLPWVSSPWAICSGPMPIRWWGSRPWR
jgi:adenine/guanine/hypoxanthine permease